MHRAAGAVEGWPALKKWHDEYLVHAMKDALVRAANVLLAEMYHIGLTGIGEPGAQWTNFTAP
jgi:hypothetical protein